MQQSEDPLTTLLRDYAEFNPPHIDIFDEPPSALEFMRYVSLNRPFVFRSGASDWEATRCWNVTTLKTILKDQFINVAVTPFGNADSPVWNENEDELLFVKPWIVQQQFSKFIDFIIEQENKKNDDNYELKEVRYCQTRMNNSSARIFFPSSKDSIQ